MRVRRGPSRGRPPVPDRAGRRRPDSVSWKPAGQASSPSETSGVGRSSGWPPPSARGRWPSVLSTSTWRVSQARLRGRRRWSSTCGEEGIMLETLTRNWWVLAVRGALAVLFGLLALIWPGITVLALVLLFGAYALVDGVMGLYTALFDRGRPGGRGGGWLVLEGVAGVLAAIGAVVWPGITALVLLYLIAAGALVTGVAEIVAAIRLRREIQGEGLMILRGALSILFGLLAFLFPGAGALAVVWLVAAYAIAFGVVMLILAFRLRRHGVGTVADGATSVRT